MNQTPTAALTRRNPSDPPPVKVVARMVAGRVMSVRRAVLGWFGGFFKPYGGDEPTDGVFSFFALLLLATAPVLVASAPLFISIPAALGALPGAKDLSRILASLGCLFRGMAREKVEALKEEFEHEKRKMKEFDDGSL